MEHLRSQDLAQAGTNMPEKVASQALDIPNFLSSILIYLICQTPVCSFLSSKQKFGFNVLDQRVPPERHR